MTVGSLVPFFPSPLCRCRAETRNDTPSGWFKTKESSVCPHELGPGLSYWGCHGATSKWGIALYSSCSRDSHMCLGWEFSTAYSLPLPWASTSFKEHGACFGAGIHQLTSPAVPRPAAPRSSSLWPAASSLYAAPSPSRAQLIHISCKHTLAHLTACRQHAYIYIRRPCQLWED